jgi:endonuclease/exonuclease/phosphatase family metal-dependent hydrolase
MPNPKLKLLSLNIEKDKHLPKLIRFFQRQPADIICLQEVYARDFLTLKKELNMRGWFAPMTKINTGRWQTEGVAILSTKILTQVQVKYYFGRVGKIPKFVLGDNQTLNRVFLSGLIKIGKENLRIGTTHFTWSANGRTTNEQRHDLAQLFIICNNYPKLVFCGDMNAPRGREIFKKLSSRYTDHIPIKYHTSINGNFHRAGQLKLMVDCLFSTGYNVKKVKLLKVPSDHYAIRAEIEPTI